MTGKFEHRMQVQQLDAAEDGWADGPGDRWETVREEMFLLRPTSGREYEQADQMQSDTTHEAKCHHFVGANSGMRLKYGERIFNVESVVNEMERNRFLAWRLVEVVQGG